MKESWNHSGSHWKKTNCCRKTPTMVTGRIGKGSPGTQLPFALAVHAAKRFHRHLGETVDFDRSEDSRTGESPVDVLDQGPPLVTAPLEHCSRDPAAGRSWQCVPSPAPAQPSLVLVPALLPELGPAISCAQRATIPSLWPGRNPDSISAEDNRTVAEALWRRTGIEHPIPAGQKSRIQ